MSLQDFEPTKSQNITPICSALSSVGTAWAFRPTLQIEKPLAMAPSLLDKLGQHRHACRHESGMPTPDVL